MNETTNRRPRVKPARTCRLLDVDTGRHLLALTEGEGANATTTHYDLAEIPTDFGRGFELAKFLIDGGEKYHVHLDAAGDSCTCWGHIRWGHKTVCKHIAAVKALVGAGRL